jgi:hypothetical protein
MAELGEEEVRARRCRSDQLMNSGSNTAKASKSSALFPTSGKSPTPPARVTSLVARVELEATRRSCLVAGEPEAARRRARGSRPPGGGGGGGGPGVAAVGQGVAATGSWEGGKGNPSSDTM